MNDFDRFRVLSFDCYGTLIDWESGITAALQAWARSARLEIAAADLVAGHGRHETHVQQENPTATYPWILGETLRRIAADFGVAATDEAARAYAMSIADWPAFADSAAALSDLKERFELVILSNVDRESFAKSNERLGVEFELIVTAQDVGSYKPDPANFDYMLARLAEHGHDRKELLHVAESLYHDHEPAQRLGISSVWINRRHAIGGFGATAAPRSDVTPRWRYRSLEEFAAAALT